MDKINKSMFSRFLTYQKERFPFLMYLIIITVFSFSAISYSLLCRGIEHFIEPEVFVICVLNAVIIFFLLRVSDEFKDQEDDAKFRSYLPVPRGLISLKELKFIGVFTVAFQIVLTFFFQPKMLMLSIAVYAYMFLMYHEFFIKSWLKKNQFWYVISHMMIIPIVDVFASGFDWFLNDEPAPVGLLLFFAVSFFNGLTLEIGRKIKSPEKEETGVLSYTFQLGTQRAVYLWIAILSMTFMLSCYACFYVHHSTPSYFVLSAVFAVSLIPAFLFIRRPNSKSAKAIEIFSSLWTFTMYLTIGGVPMLMGMF